jgi:hypothetical protein|tara:strand:- start:1252 stop:1476 length:225 start_codon:yes stop_codon:yes gene_type:complete
MNKLQIETKRNSVISGLDAKSKLEIEDPRTPIISGEQTNLTLQNRTDSKITLYMTEPQSIIIQQRSDVTETFQV